MDMVKRGSWISLLALVAVCAAACGCALTGRGIGSDDEGFAELYTEQSFSDSVSRDLIKQTRALKELQTRDYLVGPDDVLEISIFEWEMSEETRTFDFRVAQSGVISLPAVGTIVAAGRTVEEIKASIEASLSDESILQNPRVAVAVKEFRSRRIAVIGAVNAPGTYAIHENVSTLMDMLTLAGGPADDGASVAYVLRSQRGDSAELRIPVDLEELLDGGNFELNAVLQGGDVIYVPVAPLVYVYGEVQQPGGFSLTRSMRAVEAVALAGGVTERSAPGSCKLVRRLKDGGRTSIDLDLGRIEKGQVPDVFLAEGDVLYVPEAAIRNAFIGILDNIGRVFSFSYRLDD